MSKTCTIEQQKKKLPDGRVIKCRNWRCRWREHGERQQTSWTNDLSVAEADERTINERLAVARTTKGRTTLPWSEVRAKWLATLKGRYQAESKRELERYAATWQSTADATTEAMSKLTIGAARAARACVRWAWLIHNQPMDLRAMKIEPKRRRAKKAKPELRTDEDAVGAARKAAEWSAGNGAICWLILLNSIRAESLVGLKGEALQGRVLVAKNKNGEIERYQLSDLAVAILKALKPKAGSPLFLNHLGVAWETGQAFSSWFHHEIGEGVGYKVLLRCTSVTRLLELAGDARSAANVSKHKTPSLIPNTYALGSVKKERDLVERVAESFAPFTGPRLVEKQN